MMASLGMFVFELGTLPYLELQRRSEYRHAAGARVGQRDAYQFVGPGEESVSLSGVAFAEIGRGAAPLDELRTMALQGDAYALVDGSGKVHGSFVIIDVSQGASEFFPDGTARKIEFGVRLLLVDDGSSTGTGS